MKLYVRVIMSAITVFVFAYYLSLCVRGIIILLRLSCKPVNIDISNLKIKCVLTSIYTLCMLTFAILYAMGFPVDILSYALVLFSFVVALVSGIFGEVFLTEKGLSDIRALMKNNL